MKIIVIISLLFFVILSSFQTKPPAGAKPVAGIKASIERGLKVYAGTCLACHQADGLGVQRMNPPLVKTKWVLGDRKALAKIVLFGLKGGEIIIDGDDFHNPMPAQSTQFTDQQVADVLTYIRNSFGNKASAVTEADVKTARSAGATPAATVPVTKKPAPKAPVKKSSVKH
jgi:mono/diheme cytochrome c family protein